MYITPPDMTHCCPWVIYNARSRFIKSANQFSFGKRKRIVPKVYRKRLGEIENLVINGNDI